MKLTTAVVFTLLQSTHAIPAAEKRQSLAPTVQLSYGNVLGSSLLGVDSFEGTPFAQPPVNGLKLKPPQPITTNLGIIVAVGLPRAW
jgi:acetylcholinesterase